MEQWKKVEGYDREVSNLGRVRSPKQILKPFGNTSAYPQVWLKNKNRKEFVPKLVATLFVDNPNGYKFVHHKDENPWNNRADNLEWVATRSHSGKRSAERKALNRERLSKDIAQIDPNTGDIIQVWSREKLKQDKTFHFPYILRICNKQCDMRHRGYKWKYITRHHQPNLFESVTS